MARGVCTVGRKTESSLQFENGKTTYKELAGALLEHTAFTFGNPEHVVKVANGVKNAHNAEEVRAALRFLRAALPHLGGDKAALEKVGDLFIHNSGLLSKNSPFLGLVRASHICPHQRASAHLAVVHRAPRPPRSRDVACMSPSRRPTPPNALLSRR